MNGESNRHSFAYEAMDTAFEICAAYPDREYARQAAQSAFRELDYIEGVLSRFMESSDISQIDNLAAGESRVLDPYAFECLQLAQDLKSATRGAFDVAYESRPRQPLRELYTLDANTLSVQVHSAGLQLDLGGIGKGYALDKMAELLAEWEIDAALLRASFSTALATDPPPGEQGWEAGFGAEDRRHDVSLAHQALSGSGVEVQGEHIKGRGAVHGRSRYRAWGLAPTGAQADAFSTAFMIMPTDQIRACLQENPAVSAWIQTKKGAPIAAIAP